MITENHRKEMVSWAFVHSIVTKAGCKITSPMLDYGLDLGVTQVREISDARGTRLVGGCEFKVQLKSSSSVDIVASEILYDLDAKNYNDLVATDVNVPRILVFVHLPEDEEQRIAISGESITLKYCAYYARLAGMALTDNVRSERIKIPITNTFDPQFVNQFFSEIERGDF